MLIRADNELMCRVGAGTAMGAFRGTDGRVGILDEFCPHRGKTIYLKGSQQWQ